MYKPFLTRRLDSPSNGLITDEAIIKGMDGPTSPLRVEYRIYDKRGEHRVLFGQEGVLCCSSVGRSAAIASLVGYGWELIPLGAHSVLVLIGDNVFVCSEDARLSERKVREVVSVLSERVTADKREDTVQILLWIGNDRHPLLFYYLPPKRGAARNAYIGNLSRNLTTILNRPCQFGRRNKGVVGLEIETVQREGVACISTLCTFRRLGIESSYFQSIQESLRVGRFMTLVQAQSKALASLPMPTLKFEIKLGPHVYTFPLWCEELIPSLDCVEETRIALEKGFASLSTNVEVSEFLTSDMFRLDLPG